MMPAVLFPEDLEGGGGGGVEEDESLELEEFLEIFKFGIANESADATDGPTDADLDLGGGGDGLFLVCSDGFITLSLNISDPLRAL